MQLVDVLAADRIAVDISVSSKKILLEKLSALLATAPGSAPSRTIFDSLCQRERLGSTGLGHGVAIPHGRVDSQQEVAGAMVRRRQPIDFNAPDSHKGDRMLALAGPARYTYLPMRTLAAIGHRLGP